MNVQDNTTYTEQSPRELPEKFVKVYHYEKIKESGHAYLYGGRSSKDAEITTYEVFKKVVKKPGKLPGGKLTPWRVAYPGNEDFGKWAWCWSTLERALKNFDELNEAAVSQPQ